MSLVMLNVIPVTTWLTFVRLVLKGKDFMAIVVWRCIMSSTHSDSI